MIITHNWQTILVKHNGDHRRESRWEYRTLNGQTEWHITSFIDGYYCSYGGKSGKSPVEDFEKNLDILERLNHDTLEVKFC